MAAGLGGGRTVEWTTFNQAKKITDNASGKNSEFFFGAGRERVKQVRRNDTSVIDTTIYVGSAYEKITTASSGLIEHKHFVLTPGGRTAVFTDRSDFSKDTRYFHTDGLGSITVVTDEKGQVLKRYTYDAWGKQSVLFTASGGGITNTAPTNRGFTDHEMLADLGLVHMNGRIYDPLIGRFISADPHVDDARDAQGFNRYSYVGNNPLGATDPTGYFKLKDALKIVATVAVAVVAATYLGPIVGQWIANAFHSAGISTLSFEAVISGVSGGLTGGFGSGFAGSLLNGGSLGDAFKAGATGGISGAVTGGLLGWVGSIELNNLWRGIAHGGIHGAAAEATGGEFRHGFYSGFAVGASEGQIGTWARHSDPKGIVAAAVIGGTASAVGGGKFANGAVGGAFSYLFNYLSAKNIERADIAFVDVSEENDLRDVMLRTAEKFAKSVVSVRAEQDVINYFERTGKLVDRIMFFNHNNRYGAMHIGGKWVESDSAMWVSISEHISPSGELILFGCAAGRYTEFVQAVSNVTNV